MSVARARALPDPHRALGSGRRGDGRHPRRAARGAARRDHARHGRHERGRGADPRLRGRDGV
jgi:hypothetical protein